MERQDELRHIHDGAAPGEEPDGWRRAIAACDGDATIVRDRSAEVLSAALTADPAPRSPEEWASVLPPWFVRACAPERTRQQADEYRERLRTLSLEDKRRHAHTATWSLSAWTRGFTAEDRWWYWWDSRVIDEDRLELIVETPDVQAGLGTLEWLLRAAGATAVALD